MKALGVELKPLESDDLEDLAVWRQHPDNFGFFTGHIPITVSGQKDWYQSYLRNDNDMIFVISDSDGRRFGTVGLSSIDHKNQKAEFGRFLIGDSEMRGKGYGKEALNKLIEFGFCELNLHKIYLRVFADNEGAISLYEQVGFSREGLLRDDHFSNGRWRDVVLMAIFRRV